MQSQEKEANGNENVASLDVAIFLENVNKLSILSTPFTKVLKSVDQLRRWECIHTSATALAMANCLCLITTAAYPIVLMLVGVACLCGLGILHRKTQCLVKVLPSVNSDNNNQCIYQIEETDPHTKLMQQYKAVLFQINAIVQQCNESLDGFYTILKWDQPKQSSRWFMGLTALILGLQFLPLGVVGLVCVNAFFLQHKLHNYLTADGSTELTSPGTSLQGSPSHQSQSSESSLPEEDMDGPDHDFYDGKVEKTVSSSDSSDMEMDGDRCVTGGSNVSRRSRVVDKILELKRKQGSAAIGTCVGCRANFTSILKRRHVCSHCGNHFCSRCCAGKVPRSVFGATAPAAQTETVPVCNDCFKFLTTCKAQVS